MPCPRRSGRRRSGRTGRGRPQPPNVPLGVAVSSRSFGRVIRVSASAPVRWKPPVGIDEQPADHLDQRPRVLEPSAIACRLEQGEQSQSEERVIVEEPGSARRSPATSGPGVPPHRASMTRRTSRSRSPRRDIAGSSKTRPAIASAPIASPFQAATTLSSIAGWARCRRRSSRTLRPSSMACASATGSTPCRAATVSRASGSHRTFVPSQFPSGRAPNASATGSPTSRTSSSHDPTRRTAPRRRRCRRPARSRTRPPGAAARGAGNRPCAISDVAVAVGRASRATRRVYS